MADFGNLSLPFLCSFFLYIDWNVDILDCNVTLGMEANSGRTRQSLSLRGLYGAELPGLK